MCRCALRSINPKHVSLHTGPCAAALIIGQNPIRVCGRRHHHPFQSGESKPLIIGRIPDQHDAVPAQICSTAEALTDQVTTQPFALSCRVHRHRAQQQRFVDVFPNDGNGPIADRPCQNALRIAGHQRQIRNRRHIITQTIG